MNSKNKAYQLCSSFLGKTKSEMAVSYNIKFDNNNILIRRNHVNDLYFNIVNSLLDDDKIKDLYYIREFVRKHDTNGDITKKIEAIVDSISNGNK